MKTLNSPVKFMVYSVLKALRHHIPYTKEGNDGEQRTIQADY